MIRRGDAGQPECVGEVAHFVWSKAEIKGLRISGREDRDPIARYFFARGVEEADAAFGEPDPVADFVAGLQMRPPRHGGGQNGYDQFFCEDKVSRALVMEHPLTTFLLWLGRHEADNVCDQTRQKQGGEKEKKCDGASRTTVRTSGLGVNGFTLEMNRGTEKEKAGARRDAVHAQRQRAGRRLRR